MSTALDPEETVTNLDQTTPLRFERRCIERWPMEGAATAFGLAGEHFGHIHEMTMCDYSHGGMGAISDTPIEPGTQVSVGFQQPGVVARRGVIRRCYPCGNGYRVGIQFELRQAA
ncbi:MAG: PilZ domain-containing protein [Phycisphaerales bacterium]|nr:MAG: PilZ domain-containing protein [Phycisphaerales bacterium]